MAHNQKQAVRVFLLCTNSYTIHILKLNRSLSVCSIKANTPSLVSSNLFSIFLE